MKAILLYFMPSSTSGVSGAPDMGGYKCKKPIIFSIICDLILSMDPTCPIA